MNYLKIIIPFCLLLFAACDVINPEEDIPSYIEIKPFDYEPENGGSTSTKITDAWIIVNGVLIGGFDLPKTIPVLASGTADIIIDPGIIDNGISATPNPYPCYTRFTTTLDLIPGEVVSVTPETAYDPATQIIFEEYFDSSGNQFEDIDASSEDVKEGDASGLIFLDDANPGILVKSNPIERFPEEGFIGYLEMDYKTEIPIFVGITGYGQLGDIVFTEFTYGLNIKEEWNKVYFNFSDVFRLLQQNEAVVYEIQISAQIPFDGGAPVLESAEVLLDNIKMVTF